MYSRVDGVDWSYAVYVYLCGRNSARNGIPAARCSVLPGVGDSARSSAPGAGGDAEGRSLTPRNLSRVDRFSIDHSAQHLCVENLRWGNGSQVAVKHDEVGDISGCELTLPGFGKFGVGRALGIGVECLPDGELLLRMVSCRAGLIHARHGGIDSTERRDWLHGIVGSEGQDDAGIEKALPSVGAFGALGAEALLGPCHVGKQVVGLHRGDDSELAIAGEVGGIDDLRMLDAVARRGPERHV